MIAAGMLMTFAGQAQTAAPKASFLDNYFNEIVLILLILVLSLFLLSAIVIFQRFLGLMIDQLPEEKQVRYRKSMFSWDKINKTLTDAVPVEEEADIMLDHEYDGIRELDNHLPPWWKWLFYATIVYAVVYMAHHYVFQTGKDQYEIYEAKVAEAEAAKAAFLSELGDNVDETNVEFVDDPAVLAEGKKLFVTKCAACHGMLGEGAVGPNLTDQYWIHGGTIVDVFKTVKYGIANKMIAWESQLLPSEMESVSSYVLTLQGTNPPNGKEAQGELYIPPPPEADDEGEAVDAAEEDGTAAEDPEATASAE